MRPRTARTLYTETRTATIALALLLVFGTVLITPDPSDDIDGVTFPHRAVTTFVLAQSLAPMVSIFRAGRLPARQPSWPSMINVLQLVCVFRC